MNNLNKRIAFGNVHITTQIFRKFHANLTKFMLVFIVITIY